MKHIKRDFSLKQPIIGLYFEFVNELKFYNLKARLALKDLRSSGSFSLVAICCRLMEKNNF